MQTLNVHKLTGTTVALIILALVAPTGLSAACQDWSPDGKWLAFLTQTGDASTGRILPPGWWARQAVPFERESVTPDAAQLHLWVCQRDSRRCWRLASNELGLSGPAWSPDGRELVYVRLLEDAAGHLRGEVMLQHGFEPPRVLTTCESRGDAGDAQGLTGRLTRTCLASAAAAPAWSPHGNFVAVPWLDPAGAAVIRVSDGTVVAKYPDAVFVSWSPDERRLAFVLPGESAGYHVTVPDLGPAVAAVATRIAQQPAVWEPAGNAFHAIVWREAPSALTMPPSVADLVRFDVARGRPETVRQILTKRPAPSGEPANLHFVRIPDSGSLFVLASGEGHSTEAMEFELARQTATRRHTILDRELIAGAPSVGPDKQTVAVRIGAADSSGVPALYDLRTAELRWILPDEHAQILAAQSIAALIADATDTLTRPVDGKFVAWNVRLPSPRALTVAYTRDPRFGERVERLARFGRAVLDAEPPERGAALSHRQLAEATMFLSYMAGDYRAALAATEKLEPLLNSNYDRLALSVVRAQCYLGARKFSDARQLLTLLRQKAVRPDEVGPADEGSLAVTVQRLLDELDDAEK